ncbi:MAG: hypothetical protein JXQ30_08565 [Spirochaetes bacterium]|nr:hypothetical protein [Spirochaetota bacterium]
MLLVKKGVLYAVFSLMAAVILALGLINYIRLQDVIMLRDILGLSEAEQSFYATLKFYAENLLYLSFVGVVLLFVVFLIIQTGSVRVFREIDKVTELSAHGRYYSGDYTRKLGRLGEKIHRLFGELNRLDEMKSLKISALSNLVGFFLENGLLHCFVTDIQGSIGSVSKRLCEKLKIEGKVLKGRTLSEVVKDFDFSGVTEKLERNRTPVERKGLVLDLGETSVQGQFTFYPVFNSKNELSNIVCVSEKETLREGITKKADQIREAQKRITGIFKKRSHGKNRSGD